jgi:hypothetical protein
VEAAQAQSDHLGAQMPAREVGVCVDETFDPAICLVAIEPVSHFILAEHYTADRTATTWHQTLEQALAGLPVRVIQGISDEAGALRHLIEKDLQAAHASDLFHGQHEGAKGTGLPLARQVKQADVAVPSPRRKRSWTPNGPLGRPMRQNFAIGVVARLTSRRAWMPPWAR